jgi:triosephosphate isomerase
MNRQPLVAGNWKMHKTTTGAASLAQDISNRFPKNSSTVEVVLCPPFTSLKTVRTVLEFDKSSIALGAQDVFWEAEGAYTGAISPAMLKEVGCSFTIVGHSERREYFAESDLMVSKKAKALLDSGITPIICVGEGLEKREEGAEAALSFITAQLEGALQLISKQDVARIVVAYEPIWAIGTGRTATPEVAQDVCLGIRRFLGGVAGEAAANSIRILYGGSMKPENAALFAPQPDIDGGLIGGASLDAPGFTAIVKAFQ